MAVDEHATFNVETRDKQVVDSQDIYVAVAHEVYCAALSVRPEPGQAPDQASH